MNGTRLSGVNLVRSLGVVGPFTEISRFHPKKFPMFTKKSDFFSRQVKKFSYLTLKFQFLSFTPTFLLNSSLYLKTHFPTYFHCKIGYNIFRDPATTPATPPTTLRPPKNLGVAIPNPPEFTPVTQLDSWAKDPQSKRTSTGCQRNTIQSFGRDSLERRVIIRSWRHSA